jgi:multicomponent Na+:H+ antiporter subunit C
MDDLAQLILSRFNYWIYVVLMMIGLYAMISKHNLIKKLIGMSIFQTAIILFYVSIGVKNEATIPIAVHPRPPAERSEGAEPAAPSLRAEDYTNPLPHVLMLTAIVVGVSTLGVGLALAQTIHRQFGTLEENELLHQLKQSDD